MGLINSGLPNPSDDLTPGGLDDSSPTLASYATLTPAPSPKCERSAIELIAAGDKNVADIARASGISILELARIVTAPDNLRQLQQVAQLHAIEREMLLGKLKRKTLMRLGELTDEVAAGSADEIRASEVMRKACVDLLRYGEATTSNTSLRQTQSLTPEPITPASEAAILEALERLGEERDEYPQIEDSPGRSTQITQMNRGGFKSESKDRYERRAQASGSVELAGWSKAELQATPKGEAVREVEVTHDVQLGMAFGKTSDHGPGKNTESGADSNRTDNFGRNAGLRCQQYPSPPPDSPPDIGLILTRTQRVPLYIRSMQSRTPNNKTRTLPADAHPP